MIRIELTESEQQQLLRYLDSQAKIAIKQQHEIKETCMDDMTADDRAQILSLANKLKWFNRFINAISNGKKI